MKIYFKTLICGITGKNLYQVYVNNVPHSAFYNMQDAVKFVEQLKKDFNLQS